MVANRTMRALGSALLSQCQVVADGVGKSCMYVPGGSGEAFVSKGALYDVNGCTAVQGVAGGGASQPMGRGVVIQPCGFCAPFNDIPDAFARERDSCALPDMVSRQCVPRGLARCSEGFPYGARHEHFPGVLSFSMECPPSPVVAGPAR